jgi:hypothetical protein
MKRNVMILAMAALVMMPSPVQASETTQAVAGAVGAAAGAAVSNAVVSGPNGAQLNCNALDIKDMSDQDIINVRRACDAIKVASPPEPVMSPDDVREWAGLAKEFGSAIGQTAKELGVAVNDFLRTPAGILLTVYLFWSKLGGILIGIPFVMLVWTAFFMIWNRYRRTPTAFEYRPVLFGLWQKQVVTDYDYTDAGDVVSFGAFGAVATTIITAFIVVCVIL